MGNGENPAKVFFRGPATCAGGAFCAPLTNSGGAFKTHPSDRSEVERGLDLSPRIRTSESWCVSLGGRTSIPVNWMVR